jgi:hypothetical protein
MAYFPPASPSPSPPVSPRQPAKSSQEDLPKPRTLEVLKTSPRKNFPITKAEAVQRRKEEKEKQILADLRVYENEEFKIVIESTLEERKSEPEIETVQTVLSPRGEFESRRAFFENLSGSAATSAPTSTPARLSRPPNRPLPNPPSAPEPSAEALQSPRREALAALPSMRTSESEKPS